MTKISGEQIELRLWICTKCGHSGLMEIGKSEDMVLVAIGQHGEQSNCSYSPAIIMPSPYIAKMYSELLKLRKVKEAAQVIAENALDMGTHYNISTKDGNNLAAALTEVIRAAIANTGKE